MSEKSETVK